MFFGKMFPTKRRMVSKLFTEAFRYWPDATRYSKKHQDPKVKGLHFETSLFLNQSSGKSQPINAMVDDQFKAQVAENRKKLKPIIDCILFCDRTGIAYRAYRDESKYHSPVGEYATESGVGNFVELLNFAVRRGDNVLRDQFENCPKNASYISKTSQNQLADCCGKVITNSIIEKVKQAKLYSIIADECSKSSSKEQLSLVLRFFDPSNFEIKRIFFAFYIVQMV